MTERPARPNWRGERRGTVRDRVTELRRVRAGDLQESPANWRRHPERQRAALRALLGQIGYADALLAREDQGRLVLVDGHLRRSLDPDQVVPVLVLDVSAEEADTLLATLDPLAGLAQPDPVRLAELLERVQTSSRAVQDLLDAVARGAGLPVVTGRTDPDEVPPFASQPTARVGDLWALGDHRLACADARRPGELDRLLDGALADALWTDPPYGVAYVGKTRASLTIEGDDPAALAGFLDAAFASIDGALRPGAALYVAHPAGPQSVTFAQAFLGAGWSIRQSIVWVKDAMVIGHSDYHYRHEPLLYGRKPGAGRWGRGHAGWYGGNAETSVLEVPRPRASREHPTAKPVMLVRRCLANSSAPGEIVLDPFVGSGTTLIACEQLARRCYAVEIDPRYAEVAVARWEAFTGERARLLQRQAA